MYFKPFCRRFSSLIWMKINKNKLNSNSNLQLITQKNIQNQINLSCIITDQNLNIQKVKKNKIKIKIKIK
jgi:hypothetical protein